MREFEPGLAAFDLCISPIGKDVVAEAAVARVLVLGDLDFGAGQKLIVMGAVRGVRRMENSDVVLDRCLT